MKFQCENPIVFVHGLFGWGENEGINSKVPYWGAFHADIPSFLMNNGAKECYAASVGPISGAWDRACELYAALTGTRVDYGKAHAEKFHHRRFGRTYDAPMFEGWGENKKIHLIGHSFGGITVRLLAHLLAHGAPEEQAATDAQELSPLFAGGKEHWVQSVMTICAPNNGTTAFDVCNRYYLMPVLEGISYSYAGVVGRSPLEGGFVDFHMEQFGLSNTPGQKDALPMRGVKKQIKQTDDSIRYDMSIPGAALMNERIEISPDVYYFSYSFNSLRKKGKKQRYAPVDFSFPLMKATSALLLFDYRKTQPDDDAHFRDFANDGLVNLWSAEYPDDEPHRAYDGEIAPGVWNVMPVRSGDHGTAIGLMTDPVQTKQMYMEILGLLAAAEADEKSKNKKSPKK